MKEMNNYNDGIEQDLRQLLDQLEEEIPKLISDLTENQADPVVNIQLREITNTIERLDKQGAPVPKALIDEKLRLFSLAKDSTVTIDLAREALNRLNAITGQLSQHVKSTRKRDRTQSKPRGTGLPTTRQEAYREHIIEALVSMGGSGKAPEVLRMVEDQMRGQFLPGDLELRNNEPVWRNTARWEVAEMKDLGILMPTRIRGVWELNPNYKK